MPWSPIAIIISKKCSEIETIKKRIATWISETWVFFIPRRASSRCPNKRESCRTLRPQMMVAASLSLQRRWRRRRRLLWNGDEEEDEEDWELGGRRRRRQVCRRLEVWVQLWEGAQSRMEEKTRPSSTVYKWRLKCKLLFYRIILQENPDGWKSPRKWTNQQKVSVRLYFVIFFSSKNWWGFYPKKYPRWPLNQKCATSKFDTEGLLPFFLLMIKTSDSTP